LQNSVKTGLTIGIRSAGVRNHQKKPDLKWKDDDERLAWWIIGGEAKANNKYEGKADFLNTDAGKYGMKIQVLGATEGDVLIQPYSGGYGYGMIRSKVSPSRR
jgi:hypothetical protein